MQCSDDATREHLAATSAACFVGGGVAAATETYRLRFEAPSGCPTEREERDDIQAHVSEGRRADGLSLDLRIIANEHGLRGVLVTTERDGRRGERSVEGRTCTEVAHALAFLAGLAIALDDSLDTAPASANAQTEPSDAGGPPSAPIVAPAVDSLPEPEPSPMPSMEVGRGEAPWLRSATVSGEIRGGLAPSPSLGATAGLGLEYGVDGIFAPAARLEVTLAHGQVNGSAGSADVLLSTGRLTACPIRVGALSGFSIRPCADAEVGLWWAAGSTAALPRSPALPWVSLGATLHLQWVFRSGWFVEVDGGATFPLVRPRLFFEGSPALYVVPGTTERLAIGPGVRF